MARVFSIEDGTLNSATLVTSRRVDYKDIDLTFTAKPSGEIYKKVDAAAVKQAVKNLLLTSPGEKPFNPQFGGGLNRLLFELLDDDAEDEIDDLIRISISNFEPRALVVSTDIKPAPDSNSIRVTVVFQVRNTGEQVVLETTITRFR